MTVYDYREITLKDDLCLEISRDTDIENPRENDCNAATFYCLKSPRRKIGDIITFWQRTDAKHMQRYKGTVKYDETLTSFTVVSCEPNRLSDPVFLWDCSNIHVVGNIFDGELSKREQEVSCTYTKCLALAKSIDTLQLCYGPYFNSLKVESLWSKAFELMDDVTRSEIVEDLKLFQRAWRKYKEEKPVKDTQKILDAISELFGEEVTSK